MFLVFECAGCAPYQHRSFASFLLLCLANQSVIYLLCFFLFEGNLLVIITILRFMNRNNVTNIFIFNLSLSDLLVAAFCLPLRVSTCQSCVRFSLFPLPSSSCRSWNKFALGFRKRVLLAFLAVGYIWEWGLLGSPSGRIRTE